MTVRETGEGRNGEVHCPLEISHGVSIVPSSSKSSREGNRQTDRQIVTKDRQTPTQCRLYRQRGV